MKVSSASVSPVHVCHLYVEGSGAGDHFKQVVPHHQLTAEHRAETRAAGMFRCAEMDQQHIFTCRQGASLTSVCTPALCESPSTGWLSAPPSPTRKKRGENKRRFTTSRTRVATGTTLRKPHDSSLCYVCQIFPRLIWILTLSGTGNLQENTKHPITEKYLKITLCIWDVIISDFIVHKSYGAYSYKTKS